MSQVKLTINGREVSTDVEPRLSLADFLRDHIGLTGTHLGCEHGVCGACTVLLNGKPVRSCISLTVSCENMEVRTIEGFDDDAVMAVLRNAFSEEHGVQCGFCTPGVLISARDIVTRLPNLPRQRLREELSRNLCRCTGYAGILRAIEVAMEELKIGGGAK